MECLVTKCKKYHLLKFYKTIEMIPSEILPISFKTKIKLLKVISPPISHPQNTPFTELI